MFNTTVLISKKKTCKKDLPYNVAGKMDFVTIITGVLSRTRRRSELSNFKMAVQQQLFNP